MHFIKLLLPASTLLLGSWIQGISAVPLDEGTALSGDLLTELRDHAIEALESAEGDKVKRGKCTLATASVRKDWARLSSREKKDYIRAVQCLQKKPSKSDPTFAPGARSRYDDFVAIHIDQTFSIHATVRQPGSDMLIDLTPLLLRATFSHGIATSSTPMRRRSRRSVATRARTRTGTGSSTRTTRQSRPSSTAATPASAAMARSSRTTAASPAPTRFFSPRATAAAASPAAPLRTWSSTWAP